MDRYAFTPLLDASEDEDEEREQPIPYDAFGNNSYKLIKNHFIYNYDSLQTA